MTAPAPKPIADCPNPECGYDRMTILDSVLPTGDMRLARQYFVDCAKCNYHGPRALSEFDAIRLHNLLCRPNPETQAVALAREHEAGHAAAEQSAVRFLKAHLATLTHTEAVADCLHCSLNYLISRFIDKHRALSALLESPRSPVESVPVSVLNRLVIEFQSSNEPPHQYASISDIRRECADRLSAIVKEYSK